VNNSALGSNNVWDGLAGYTNSSSWTNTVVYGTNKASNYTIVLKKAGNVSTPSSFSLTEYTITWTNGGSTIPTAISKLANVKAVASPISGGLNAPASNGDVCTNSFTLSGTNSATGIYTQFSGATNTLYSGANYAVTYAMVKDAIGATNLVNGKSPAFLSFEGVGIGGTTPTNSTVFQGDEQTNAMNKLRDLCQNGGYSLWAYETSILNPLSATNSGISTIYSGIVTAITSSTNMLTPYQPKSRLNVTKAMEGAVIYNK
jgi:hypothetical protein